MKIEKVTKMVTKVMKYKIIPNKNNMSMELWDEIYKNMTDETLMLLNKATSLCWEYENLASQYIKDISYSKDKCKEVLGYTDLQGYCYDRLKGDSSVLYSSSLSATIKIATDKWQNDINDIKKGLKSPSIYNKMDFPLEVPKNTINIYNEGSDYFANISLLKPSYAKSHQTSTAILFDICVDDNTQDKILNRILSGEYIVCGSKMQIKHKKNKKWYTLLLTYKLEVEVNKHLDYNNILGIDLGVENACVGAFNNSIDRFYISGAEIKNFKERVESRKVDIQRQSKFCGEGRRGRGYKTRMKPLEVLGNKISNFRKITNHKYAKYIVKQALQHGCGVIQMEDLSGIKKTNKESKFLKSWTYDDLQTKIIQKAKESGIEVRKISPKYTSQKCSRCGYIHKKNRETQANFICQNCGLKINADYNAAINISQNDTEIKIKIQSYIQDLFKEDYIKIFPCTKVEEAELGGQLIKEVRKFFELHYEAKAKKKDNSKNILKQEDKIYNIANKIRG